MGNSLQVNSDVYVLFLVLNCQRSTLVYKINVHIVFTGFFSFISNLLITVPCWKAEVHELHLVGPITAVHIPLNLVPIPK